MLVMAVLMLINSSGLYLYLKAQNEQILINEAQAELTYNLTRLQGTLEYLFRIGDRAQVEEEISALGASDNILRAFVIGDDKRIIASTKKNHYGAHISEYLDGDGVDVVNLSRKTKTLNIYYWANGGAGNLSGLAPILIGTQDGSIRPDKIGFLLIEYFPNKIEEITQQGLLKAAFPLLVQSAVLILILSIILYFILFRRISKFKRVAQKVADGDYSVRINSRGIDDLGVLANTFDQTVSNVEIKTKALFEQHRDSALKEENLTIILNSIGDGVITTDTKGRIVRLNEVAGKLTGWKESDALSRPLEEVFCVIDAKTRKPLVSPVEKVILSKKTAGPVSHAVLVSKRGGEYQIADSAAPINDMQGQLIGVILVFRDITLQHELREEVSNSHEFLQSMVDYSPSLISARDLEGNFVLSNKAHASFLGLTPKEVTSTSIRELFSEEVAAHYTKSDQEVIHSESVPGYEEIHLKDEQPHTFFVSKFKLLRNGSVYAVGTIATDVTVLRQQEEQIKRSQKMDALGKLTGGIAHDYNNMMGIILGYAELLAPHLEDEPKLKGYIERITHAGIRGADLTQQLLSFARLKPGKISVSGINTLVLNSADMLRKTLTHKIKLNLELSSVVWDCSINAGEFEDALINLSINAMHAMPEGGTLTIRTVNQSLTDEEAGIVDLKYGDYIKVSIEDTGVGIKQDVQMKIFDPFFTTKGEEGNGLGLSQVYSFVRSSGGVIRVESVLSEGTQFHLYFPRAANEIKTTTERKTEALTLVDAEPRQKKSILVVDDEPILANLAAEILKNQGYNTFLTSSGDEALNIVQNNNIDLLVTDIVMPEISGYELAKKIKEINSTISVLVVSGYNDGGAVDGNDNNYMRLQKPYRSDALIAAVKKMFPSSS